MSPQSGSTYRIDDPRGTVPGGGVDSGPEVEEDDGSDATASQVVLRVLGWLNDADVASDDPHAEGTGDGTDEKKLSSSELIDEEEKPDKGHNGLDNTEDTSHQVDSVALNTDAGENGRGVVVNGVDTGAVLPEEQHAAQEQAPLQIGTGTKGLEGLPEAESNSGLG